MNTLMSQTAVLEWLAAHHPSLLAQAELERDWLWLASTDLQGEAHKVVRDSLKEIGFQFKVSGDHALPSGRLARWGHSCLRPVPKQKRHWKNGKQQPQKPGQRPLTDAELLAAIQ